MTDTPSTPTPSSAPSSPSPAPITSTAAASAPPPAGVDDHELDPIDVMRARGKHPELAALLACFLAGLVLIIVRRAAGTIGFVVQPRRRVVDRSLGWLGRWRRLSKEYEALPEVSEAMAASAMIRLMVHRLAHPNRRRLSAP